MFPHLFQPAYAEIMSGFLLRSRWGEKYFKNEHPITIELGCGKGEYTVGLAEMYPDRNFIGIDNKGARLWRGCKTVEEKQLKNAAFIRTLVDHVESLFSHSEVDEIWITFPDPQKKKEYRRLTSPAFLEKYRNILNPKGIIHLKTDDPGFYQYTLDVIQDYQHRLLYSTNDLYLSELMDDVGSIKTYYETRWLEMGKKICYLRFQLNDL